MRLQRSDACYARARVMGVMSKSMNDTIAERDFILDCEDEKLDVVVSIKRPILDESGNNWTCPYEISYGSKTKRKGMHGVDSIQALSLTLRILDTELEFLEKQVGGKLLSFGKPFLSISN